MGHAEHLLVLIHGLSALPPVLSLPLMEVCLSGLHFLRSVGTFLSPTCYGRVDYGAMPQVFIPLKEPRGVLTHGERLSAKTCTTAGYGQTGQSIPVVVHGACWTHADLPADVGRDPSWVLYFSTAYGTS